MEVVCNVTTNRPKMKKSSPADEIGLAEQAKFWSTIRRSHAVRNTIATWHLSKRALPRQRPRACVPCTSLDTSAQDPPTCGQQSDRNFVPTLLIHISGAMPSLEVRLYVTKPQDKGFEYCCLSHCWGNHDLLSLRSTNLQQMEQNIPLKDFASNAS